MGEHEQMSLFELLSNQEKFKSEQMGIEYTSEELNSDVEKPYNANEIRIDNRSFSVFQVNKWIDEEEIDLMPEFQRNKIWTLPQKSLLIESLMLRITLPAFYLSEDENGKKSVIDGLQRLTAISQYMSNEFALEHLQYLSDECDKKKFDELPAKYRRRIEDGQLYMNILDERCPDQVKLDVFRRVNTGGVPLNNQEIRNVLAEEKVRKLLKEMSGCTEFQLATRGLISDLRMEAQELCLRYIAFDNLYNSEKKMILCNDTINTKELLDQCILNLNQLDVNELNEIFKNFQESMEKCKALLGNTAFSKPDGRHVINKMLFTSWGVALKHCIYSVDELFKKQEIAITEYTAELMHNKKYRNAVTSATNSKINIHRQFQFINEIIRRVFS